MALEMELHYAYLVTTRREVRCSSMTREGRAYYAMKNGKQIATSLPEYYLSVLVLLAGYTPPLSVNPVALMVVFILVLQIILRNDICGVIIAGLLLLINLYMLMALLSEFSEFAIFNSAAMQLLLGGVSLFFLNLVASVLMLWRYTAQPQPRTSGGS